MKKLLSLLIVLTLVVGTYAFAETLNTPGYRIGPGAGFRPDSGKYPQDPHKTFRLVRYVQQVGGAVSNEPDNENDGVNDGGILSEDSIVVWHTSYDDGVTITTTGISQDSRVAGIIAVRVHGQTFENRGNAASDDVGKKNWTFLQTYGKAEVRLGSILAVTEGQAMGTSNQAGRATYFVATPKILNTDASASVHQGFGGFFYDAGDASATDVECFVRCD